MIKKLDRYLIKAFLSSLTVVTLAVGLTIIVINAVEELQDFIDHDVPLLSILEYYFYFGGWVIKSFMPMFVLLATLFSISILARRNEILAMKACGRSLYRLTAPILLMSILIAAGHFYYNEYVFPPANQRRVEIKEFVIEKRSRQAINRVSNIYRQISKGYFYTIAVFNVDRGEGSDIRIYKAEGGRISEITTAPKIEYVDHRWIATDAVVRTFDPKRGESYHEQAVLILDDIKEKPTDFSKRIGKPEDMGYDELKDYIELMKRTGGPYAREAVDLKVKISYPISSCIVVLLSIPFASNPRRGGIAVSIAVGAGISLAYFVLFRTLQSAGYSEKIPQELAVWGVNGLFFIIGLTSLIAARK
ncbi:MAG TPA: LptF/LptG family permease [candidate division Zixibacteria bacterium]|nr:LptF/LptG family permease [candidate division Zixibacteria bacterium]